ncbi:MAG: hypothetical protein H0X29_08545 [Parachlamydiaceae bacterium]|nr:hypothetical protein [Parachlamydiaceae bacterium]
MHLYALGNDEKVIYAGHADKHINYICLECAQVVRLRSGFHRQAHFYHLQPNHKCRLNGKSMSHLMLQHYLESVLPKGEVQLEHRFPLIQRIADVAWITEKIIFEVQCSPISAAEVLQRNADYASQGYQVVWLLHENRYNQKRLSAAEDALKCFPHYFSNMDAEGKGDVFDQLSFAVQGMRKQYLSKLLIDVSKPHRKLHVDQLSLPQIIAERLETWPVCFRGDYVYLCHEKASDIELLKVFLDAIFLAETQWRVDFDRGIMELSLWNFFKKIYVNYLAFSYRSVLRLILEKASR